MSKKATRSSKPEKPYSHPSLQYLALAIGTLERAGSTKDANEFMKWSICNFEQDDFMNAFARQEEGLPPFTTADADIDFAQECLQKVERESRRMQLQHDTVDMWESELDGYYQRLRERREEEVVEEERKKTEVERKALDDSSKCPRS